MAYVALYRKHRPQNFDSVIGQPHIVRTLKSAIEKNKVAHAYLFSGPRGTGKTSTAKILARALNCQHGPTTDPCGTCASCRKITEGASMDVLEIDAASNRGIDEIRSLRDTVGFLPVDGRYKVYIIDEVHMLTTEAFNALLKTLEEPPAHILFILATTEPHKIPATIHSRCQRYDFRRISAADIESRLANIVDQMQLNIEKQALKLIATAAEGGMRDALSLLDQCLTIGDGTITEQDILGLLGMVGHTWTTKLIETIAQKDSKQTLLVFSQLLANGKDPRQTLIELAEHMRNLLLAQIAPEAVDTTCDRDTLIRQSRMIETDHLTRMIKRLYEGAQESKYTSDPRISAEITLLDLCAHQYSDSEIDRLIARIADLEDKIANNTITPAAPANTPVPKPAPQTQTQTSPATKPAPNVRPSAPTADTEPSAPPTPVRERPAVHTTTYRAPMPPSRAPEVPAPPTKRTDPPTPNADHENIMKKALELIKAEGKNAVHACVKTAQIQTITDNAVILNAEREFVKNYVEGTYRTILENTFARILGRQIRISCTCGAAKPKQEQNPYANYPRAVQEGIKMFGDNITIIKG